MDVWEDDIQIIIRPHRTSTLRPKRPFPRPDAWKGDRTTIRRRNQMAGDE